MDIFMDFNADLGEGFGAYSYGADEELLPLVTSANIACGWHGGDPSVIRRAVHLAAGNGVVIGAHPGYPDRLGFGRRNMSISPQEAEDMILYQIGALDGICRAEGTRVRYVKPHGALYNAAVKDHTLASAIVRAVQSYGGLSLLCPGGSAMEQEAQRAGVRTASEFFADRGYREDGSLVPRTEPGAVISDFSAICARVLRAVREGAVETAGGTLIPVRADSVCLHGDNPEAAAIAARLRAAVLEAGIALRPFEGRDTP